MHKIVDERGRVGRNAENHQGIVRVGGADVVVVVAVAVVAGVRSGGTVVLVVGGGGGRMVRVVGAGR